MIFGAGGLFNSEGGPLLLSKQSVAVSLSVSDTTPLTVSISPVATDKALIINNQAANWGNVRRPIIRLKTIVDGKYTEAEIDHVKDKNTTLYFDVIEMFALKSIQHITLNTGSSNTTISAVNVDKSIILYRGGREMSSTNLWLGVHLSSSTNIYWPGQLPSPSLEVTVVEFL